LKIAAIELKTLSSQIREVNRQAAPHRKWRALTKGNVIRVLPIIVVLLRIAFASSGDFGLSRVTMYIANGGVSSGNKCR
jgi:hypothetical protein